MPIKSIWVIRAIIGAALRKVYSERFVTFVPLLSRKPESVYNQASCFSHQLLNLTHHPIQFVDEIGMIAVLAKRRHKRSVIPKRAVLLSTEPLEHLETVSSKLSQNRARVMQLIRGRYESCRSIRVL